MKDEANTDMAQTSVQALHPTSTIGLRMHTLRGIFYTHDQG